MTPTEIYLVMVLVGQVLPRFIDNVNKFVLNKKIRFLLSLTISLAVGIIFNFDYLFPLKQVNVQQVILTALILWTSSQAAYKMYYEGSQTQMQIRFNTRPTLGSFLKIA
jgi:hypothetical protein